VVCAPSGPTGRSCLSFEILIQESRVTNCQSLAGRAGADLRGWFGWKSVINLGGVVTARGVESYVAMRVHLMGPAKGPNFNIKLMRPS
jgi:hypothetical protein